MVLYSGQPGRVRDITVQHVQVTWVGLEDEPASYAVGFSVNSPNDLTYGALGLLTVEEFECRERASRGRTPQRASGICRGGCRRGRLVLNRRAKRSSIVGVTPVLAMKPSDRKSTRLN